MFMGLSGRQMLGVAIVSLASAAILTAMKKTEAGK